MATSQDLGWLEGSSRSIARGMSQGLWYISAIPKAGVLWHAGLEASQRETRDISDSVWDVISISGMTDTSNRHVYRKGKCPPEKGVDMSRVLEEGSCKGSPAHSVGTDSRGCW